MITINEKYTIPERWEELSPSQFLEVAKILSSMYRKGIDYHTLKISLFLALTGIKNVHPENEQWCENVWRITEHITFPYKFVYPEEKFLQLDPSVQRYLQKHLPPESGEPHFRAASKMTRYLVPDLCFSKQLLESLPESHFQGYTFTVSGEIVITSLTAAQYIDANTILQQIHSNNDLSLLPHLAQILYCPYPYSSAQAEKIDLAKERHETLEAVMYNYMGIVEWISNLSKYDILFHPPVKQSGKNLLGQNSSLYNLSSKGYGTLTQVGELPLFSYLDLLLKQTVDAVHQLKSLGKKKSEIASELNLSFQQINTIL